MNQYKKEFLVNAWVINTPDLDSSFKYTRNFCNRSINSTYTEALYSMFNNRG